MTLRNAWVLWLLLITLFACSFFVVLRNERFDSEILNLLPSDVPSVQGLKLYNQEFTQGRELAFFFESPEDIDLLAEFRIFFANALADEPWVERWIDSAPPASLAGRESISEFVLPLLMNLPPEDFKEVVDKLQPEFIQTRLASLAAKLKADSPRAFLEASMDPLGILGGVTRRLSETVSFQSGFELTSPDGSAQIFSVITNQQSQDADACREVMGQVRAFVSKVREDFGEGAPEVLITGRSAFVEEIAASMKRDIMVTTLASSLAVSVLFLVFFGALRPLFGILVLLALSALVSLAIGLLMFSALNLIAIGFCSILFGLGVDFGLLLFQRARESREEDAELVIREAVASRFPSIASVALTTAVGFSALGFSSSEGFTQLGVLTALGVICCALFMPLWMFLFISKRSIGRGASRDGLADRLPSLFKKYSRLFLLTGGILTFAAAVITLPALHTYEFDVSPRSLEPKNAPASVALQKMMAAFPSTFEPMMILVPYPSVREGLDAALRVEAALRVLQDGGAVLGFSGASTFLLQQDRILANRKTLAGIDWDSVQRGFLDAVRKEGLALHPSSHEVRILSALQQESRNSDELQWSWVLPSSSSWWFLLDRAAAPAANTFLISVQFEKSRGEEIANFLSSTEPAALVTGWSTTLESLKPWARSEFRLFVFGVSFSILLLLAFIYRSWRAWILHVAVLLSSSLLIAALIRLADVKINLLNVLAFPLIIGVGVDYATHFLLAIRGEGEPFSNALRVFKPVLVSGLTTFFGFGALMLAENPALSGLGVVCAIGVGSCLTMTLLLVPALSGWVRGCRRAGLQQTNDC